MALAIAHHHSLPQSSPLPWDQPSLRGPIEYFPNEDGTLEEEFTYQLLKEKKIFVSLYCVGHNIVWKKTQMKFLANPLYVAGAHAYVLPLQLCLTLCNLMDCSSPGSAVRGILKARILESVAISSSRGSSDPEMEPAFLMSPASAVGFFTTCSTWEAHIWQVCAYVLSCFSHVQLFVIPWTVARQVPLSKGFSRQEY